MDHRSVQQFRDQQFKTIPDLPGVYILVDANGAVLYVGASRDSIRARTQRHGTSARSDLISNHKLYPEEVAFIWVYEEPDLARIPALEAWLIWHHNSHRPLFNSKLPKSEPAVVDLPERVVVQILPDDVIAERGVAINMLHYHLGMQVRLLEYIRTTKDNADTRRALDVRKSLTEYYRKLFEEPHV